MSRCIARVDICIAAVPALVSLETVETAHGRIKRPVVARVLQEVPLAVPIPVLVGKRSLLACRQSRPQVVVHLRVRVIAHRHRSGSLRRAAYLQGAVELRVPRVADRCHRRFARSTRPKHHTAGPCIVRPVEHHRAGPRRVDHRLVVGAGLPVVVLSDLQPVHVVQQILDLIKLLARRRIRVPVYPPVSIIRLNLVQQSALVPRPNPQPVVVGHRRVLLAPVPVTIQSVETPVKCIEEAVARAVVG